MLVECHSKSRVRCLRSRHRNPCAALRADRLARCTLGVVTIMAFWPLAIYRLKKSYGRQTESVGKIVKGASSRSALYMRALRFQTGTNFRLYFHLDECFCTLLERQKRGVPQCRGTPVLVRPFYTCGRELQSAQLCTGSCTTEREISAVLRDLFHL